MRHKIHYAWWVCAACAMLLFCTSGLSVNAFSIYQPYLLKQYGLTNAQSSYIIMFRNLFSLMAMIMTGKFYNKLSLRTGMTIAGLLIVLSFLLFGSASGFYMLCTAGGIMGIGYGFGTMIPIAILLKRWFMDKRNTALGICSAVTGLSTLGIPSLISFSIETAGLRKTFFMETGLTFLLVLLSFLLLRNNPEEMNLNIYGNKTDEKAKEAYEIGLERKEWIILIPMLLLVGAVMSVSYSHLAVLMTGEGFSERISAIAISVSGISLMIGKIIYGRLGDFIGNFKSNWLFAPLMLIGFVFLCVMKQNMVLLMMAMVLYSFGIAGLSIGLSAWAGDLSAQKNYDKTVRRFQIFYSAGSLLFSSLPGILADCHDGSYVSAYVFFTIASILVFVIIQTVYIRIMRRRNAGFVKD